MERYFEDENELRIVKVKFATFSGERFPSLDALTKMWDIAGDSWNESKIHGGVGILENTTLTLDELELEAMVIGNVSCSITKSESEVQSEAIYLVNDDDCFI